MGVKTKISSNRRKQFDKKLRTAKTKWNREYINSMDKTLQNGAIIENLRRTVKPLNLYYEFIKNTLGISRRTAQRLNALNARGYILDSKKHRLPMAYSTLEVILRLTDEEIKTHISKGNITTTSSRREMHILIEGDDASQSDLLKDSLRNTSKFADIRIEKKYLDEAKMMRLLKDLKKLREKYPFIAIDDKGFVDRTIATRKRDAARDAKEKKQNTLTGKDKEENDKLVKELTKSRRTNSFKDFKM